jgi:hypothetical protein
VRRRNLPWAADRSATCAAVGGALASRSSRAWQLGCSLCESRAAWVRAHALLLNGSLLSASSRSRVCGCSCACTLRACVRACVGICHGTGALHAVRFEWNGLLWWHCVPLCARARCVSCASVRLGVRVLVQPLLTLCVVCHVRCTCCCACHCERRCCRFRRSSAPPTRTTARTCSRLQRSRSTPSTPTSLA